MTNEEAVRTVFVNYQRAVGNFVFCSKHNVSVRKTANALREMLTLREMLLMLDPSVLGIGPAIIDTTGEIVWEKVTSRNGEIHISSELHTEKPEATEANATS